MKPVLYGICGPTASGKTALAVKVCKLISGEVISADSMQVYSGMDILSAQPSHEETQGIRHHLIAFVPPSEKYNASRYRQDALKAIADIEARGKRPLLCGGTGLYIDALTKQIQMSTQADEELRDKLKQIAAEAGGGYKLYEDLKRVDPDSANKYSPNDTRRVIRSLEIYYTTGKPRGETEKVDMSAEDTFDARLFALKWDRELLYRRADKRVDEMMKSGLLNEVQALLTLPLPAQETASQAIGFKEIKLGLENEISMVEAIELTKLHTRHLAKRQETWFKRDKRVTWLETDGSNFDELAEKIAKQITEEANERQH